MSTIMATLASHGFGRRRLLLLAALGVALVLPFIPPFTGEDYRRWLVGAAFMAAQAVAFDFTAGYINIVNFGFAAFVGLGGYTSGLLAVDLGIPPVIGMVVGATVSGTVGLLTGALTLRLRGIYAAVMAWFVGLALMGLIRNVPDITRGSLGLAVPSLLASSDNLPYYYVILAMLVVTFIVLAWVIRSRFGLAFRAIGQNLAAARASGINPTRYLVINFVLSCAFAGWLGGFYAHFYGILTPDVMLTSHTVEILAIAYIGGRGSLWGPAIVAFPLSIGVEWVKVQFSTLPGVHLVLYGLLLIVVMIYRPGGVAGLATSFDAWLARRRTAAAPEVLDAA
ncbi:MAG TPA: branched-chain amino acid ABC transporter permease [Candidatus Acidoferrales bacterium]|jgi:branched-chain amino acid transport system permease protein|nr:branched-chain amino acid ABC transporter permease [Candidatus Acidoferrales bacterium]